MKNIKDYTIGEAMENCVGRRQDDKDREIDGCEGCPLKDKNCVKVFECNLHLDSCNVDLTGFVFLNGTCTQIRGT